MKKICSLIIFFILLMNMFAFTASASDVTVVDFNSSTLLPPGQKQEATVLLRIVKKHTETVHILPNGTIQ